MKIYRICVVDDEVRDSELLHEVLEKAGYEVDVFVSPQKAQSSLRQEFYHAVLTNLMMPRVDGMEILKTVHKINPDIPVIMMTADASIKTSVEAMSAGAFHYLEKPLNTDELLLILHRALQSRFKAVGTRMLKEDLKKMSAFGHMIGQSPSMRIVLDLARKVARDAKVSILITGESGTGKEVLARSIHELSPRTGNAFVAVNCAALPESLMESEFFGHERGAYTGAESAREGKFRLANSGTIFLDEVAEMSPMMQSKLLRVLQDGEIQPLGSARVYRVDVRVIAATHQDLSLRVREGKFREDLFYRLNVVPIHLPPLRERREDIPDLVRYYLQKFHNEHGRVMPILGDDVLPALNAYPFPGNVRELINILERAVVLLNGTLLTASDLLLTPLPTGPSLSGSGLKAASGLAQAEAERRAIAESLARHRWNRSNAAPELQVDYKTLLTKIKKYGLTPSL